jgi:transglutaminase-like putative cysteine protease
MIFQIGYTTRFVYEQLAFDSVNEIHLAPIDGDDQRLLSFRLDVRPEGVIREHRDRFGNLAHEVAVDEPHNELVIHAESIVERTNIAEPPATPTRFASYLEKDETRLRNYPDFLNPSRYIPFSDRLRSCFWSVRPQPSEDVAWYVKRVVTYVREQFGYDKSATHVHSTVDDILTAGGGVCQDFAHLTIGLFRLAGIPARYVSGYLAPNRRDPNAPPPELASHAWLEVLLPGAGWSGFDPTHRTPVTAHHIRVAVGADYGDVPPVSGHYKTAGGRQKMSFELRVEEAPPSAEA